MGILTTALVTKPFSWEGRKRQVQAELGLEKLKGCVDSILVVPNDKLIQGVNRTVSLTESFSIVNEVLLRGIQGISESVTNSGMIGVDFTDIRDFL
jgi:cell division protein FtsZ